MWGSPRAQGSMTRQVVVDFEATRADADWRSQLWWPVSMSQANRIGAMADDLSTLFGEGQVRRALGFAAALDDTLPRDAVLLGLPNILGYARAIAATAIAAARAAVEGYELVGTAPELVFLVTGDGSVIHTSGHRRGRSAGSHKARPCQPTAHICVGAPASAAIHLVFFLAVAQGIARARCGCRQPQ